MHKHIEKYLNSPKPNNGNHSNIILTKLMLFPLWRTLNKLRNPSFPIAEGNSNLRGDSKNKVMSLY